MSENEISCYYYMEDDPHEGVIQKGRPRGYESPEALKRAVGAMIASAKVLGIPCWITKATFFEEL